MPDTRCSWLLVMVLKRQLHAAASTQAVCGSAGAHRKALTHWLVATAAPLAQLMSSKQLAFASTECVWNLPSCSWDLSALVQMQYRSCPTASMPPMPLVNGVANVIHHNALVSASASASRWRMAGSHTAVGNSRRHAICTPDRTVPMNAASYAQHCSTVESGAALFKGKIANTPGGGGRGVVVQQLVAANESVLEVAAANVLTVPKTNRGLAAWLDWLKVYTAAHGELPQALVQFLADASHPPAVRLASWLLYLRKHCSNSRSSTDFGSSSSSSTCPSINNISNVSGSGSSTTGIGISACPISPFWCSYIGLLESCSAMTAVCTGAWSEAELQQLEPPVLRSWLQCHHRSARQASLAAYMLLADGQHPVAALNLADSSADVGWAVALVKTRAHGSAAWLSLYPLHDMCNHAEREQANCKGVAATQPHIGGVAYTLRASCTIHPGQELRYPYTSPLANAQMLLGWGFTIPAKQHGDWTMAVQRHYGTLTQIPWTVAVHAAARVALQQQQHVAQQELCVDEFLLARLVTAAANLPLQLPESIWDGGQTYAAAAAALRRPQVAGSIQAHQQQDGFVQPDDVFQPLIEDSLQQEKVQTLFRRDLQQHITLLQQQQQSCPPWLGAPVAYTDRQREKAQQQRQQHAWTAAAVRNACLGQLIACDTTAHQDMKLLQMLQQHHHQQPADTSTQVPMLPQHLLSEQDTTSLPLQQYDNLQQTLVRKLALLAAYSNLQSLCDATASAAQVVLSVLPDDVEQLQQQLGLTAWQYNQGRLGVNKAVQNIMQLYRHGIPQLLQHQDGILQHVQLLKQQQQQLEGDVGCVQSELCRERLTAAIAARLEQKQLLEVAVQLCDEAVELLS